MLGVDLKTIHNWVGQGHLSGHRTKGRHLRFNRAEVVRFMRGFGYPVPETLGAASPRVVLDLDDADPRSLGRGARRLDVTLCDGLYRCALALSAGQHEVVIVDLDRGDSKQWKDFVGAVRSWPATAGAGLVGVSDRPAVRRAFLKAGGDAAIGSTADGDIKAVSTWLVGATGDLPDVVEALSA